jgi:hypothetical protein
VNGIQAASAPEAASSAATGRGTTAPACTLHGDTGCLRCMPPEEYYRWRMARGQIGLFHLPSYWALQQARLSAETDPGTQ